MNHWNVCTCITSDQLIQIIFSFYILSEEGFVLRQIIRTVPFVKVFEDRLNSSRRTSSETYSFIKYC